MLILKPHFSEKSDQSIQSLNTYVFWVPLTANKATIKQSVQQQYQVRVVAVRTVRTRGKLARSRSLTKGRNPRRQPVFGRRATTKKAYVTLQPGDSIKAWLDLTTQNDD